MAGERSRTKLCRSCSSGVSKTNSQETRWPACTCCSAHPQCFAVKHLSPAFAFIFYFFSLFPSSFFSSFFFIPPPPRPSVSTFKSLKCFPLPGPPSCFYPCRFPFSLSLLLIALKHQSITCTGCGLCLGAVRQPAFQGRAPPPPRWAPRCSARSNSAAGGGRGGVFFFPFFFSSEQV